MPNSHSNDLKRPSDVAQQAGLMTLMTLLARGQRTGEISGGQVASRAKFRSNVLPEWGLAGNAAFIVAPQSRTLGLNIGGRAFMHSYDYH